MKVGMAVGEKEAAGLMADAYSKFVQGSVSLGAVGITGGLHLGPKGTSSQITNAEKSLSDLKAFKTKVNGGNPDLLMNERGPQGAVPPNAKPVMEGWANNTRALPKKGVALTQDEEDAVKHLGSQKELHEKVMKRVEAEEGRLHGEINKANTSFNSQQNISSMIANALSSGVGGYFTTQQAQASVDKAEENAANAIIQQMAQQLSSQEQSQEKNAQDAIQQIIQWASSFAQAAASQVHG